MNYWVMSGSNDSNWFTTEKINKIKYVHDYLNNNEYIGKVLSLASSIRSLKLSMMTKNLTV